MTLHVIGEFWRLSCPLETDCTHRDCGRLSLETIISALVVILAHIFFEPGHESSPADLKLSQHVLRVLHQLSNISKDEGLLALQNLCASIFVRAERALQDEQQARRR
jgi:hypothetical protein